MKYPDNPSYSDEDYEGCVTAGRATGRSIPPPSDEDLRRAEEAWNDMRFYHAVMDDDGITAGYVPKPTVDPNGPLIPTVKEIEKLPRWARVAFAARCARRLQPLVKYHLGEVDWPKEMCQEFLEDLERAVNIAEAAAANIPFAPAQVAKSARSAAAERLDRTKKSFNELDAEAGLAFAAAGRAYPSADPRNDPGWAAAREADVRVEVAREQLYAAEREMADISRAFDRIVNPDHYLTRLGEREEGSFGMALQAFVAAVRGAKFVPVDRTGGHEFLQVAVESTVTSLFRIATIGTINIITTPAHDFDRLRQLAQKEKWTDDTPVPPSVFGPMWEGTPPAWWTDNASTQ